MYNPQKAVITVSDIDNRADLTTAVGIRLKLGDRDHRFTSVFHLSNDDSEYRMALFCALMQIAKDVLGERLETNTRGTLLPPRTGVSV